MPIAAPPAAVLPPTPAPYRAIQPALASGTDALRRAADAQAELLGAACNDLCPDSLPKSLLHLRVVTYTAQAAMRVIRAADSMLGALVDLRA